MSKGIFITGTDTGVGKTIVAATISMILKKRGIKRWSNEARNQRVR